jgi:hypothetical protein
MSGEPIDPTPFEPAMPPGVRDEITLARAGRGAIAAWLVARGRGWGQVGATTQLLRDPKVAPELAGWLAGIAMFGDDTDRLADVLEGHAAARFALEAFAAGVVAGVPPAPGQWERVERLTAIGRPPASLAAAIAMGCASDAAPIRAAALRIAQRLGPLAGAALASARERAKGNARRRLGAAGATLAPPVDHDGAREALLVRLLDGWRATRSADLEPAIAELGAELARARGGIAARSREDLETAWAAVAKQRDPCDVDRLLDAPWPKHLDAAKKRVAMLRKFSPDPRIVRKVAIAVRKHRSTRSLKLHGAVADLVVEMATRGVVDELDAIAKVHEDGEIVEVYREARALCADAVPLASDPALLDEAHALRGDRPDLDGLWAAHATDPGDLAHRAVLGDALQLAGDPRGELIALQLADTCDAAAKRRIAELLAAHADAWTGPIPGVVKSSRRFERGFLVELACSGFGPDLAATFDRVEWVTVEDLYIDAAHCRLAPLVRRMPLLRRLGTPHADLLAQLARSGSYPSIEALACRRGWLPPRAAFPNLRAIACRWIDGPWNDAFASAQRAVADLGIAAIVHLNFPLEHLDTALGERSRGPAETRFALGGAFAGFATGGWRVRVFRDKRYAELAWGGGSSALKAMQLDVREALRRAMLAVTEVKRIALG